MFDMTELIISLMICGVPDVPLWGIEGAASIHYLILTTDSTCDRWALPYPVYRLETGDVDGDGNTDALEGVIKGTRFHPEKGRRLFIFKNHHGLVRPLWLGSKLGGRLIDFRFTDGRIRSLEAASDNIYVVAEYEWDGFGPAFYRYIVRNADEQTARMAFSRTDPALPRQENGE